MRGPPRRQHMAGEIFVGLIGQKFMGRAHSNAWRQVSHFMDSPLEPVLKVVCGRTQASVKEASETLGWQEYATDWREVVNRKDIAAVSSEPSSPDAFRGGSGGRLTTCAMASGVGENVTRPYGQRRDRRRRASGSPVPDAAA